MPIVGLGGRLGHRLRRKRKETEEEKKEREFGVPDHLKSLIAPDKIEMLQARFQVFDTDKSGLISVDELGIFMRSLGFNPPESRISEIVAEYDKDGNGNLSFGEFIDLWHAYCMEAEQERDLIGRAFEFFDQDDSKAISFSEFKAIMTQVGDPLQQEELDLFFKLVDTNNDGMLNFEEFVYFLYQGTRDLTRR